MNESATTTRFPWRYGLGVAAVCLALTMMAYALGVGPLLQRHRDTIALRAQLAARTAHAGELNSSVSDLQRQLASAAEELERMPLRLQPASLINQRVEAVARLATECGLALDEMNPGAAVDAAHYQTVPLRIVGIGEYPACAKFLRRLRQTFGDMGVRTFTASHQGGAVATPAALFRAELIWFTELPRK